VRSRSLAGDRLRAWLTGLLGLTVRLQDLSGLLALLPSPRVIEGVEILVSPWGHAEQASSKQCGYIRLTRGAWGERNTCRGPESCLRQTRMNTEDTQQYAFAVRLRYPLGEHGWRARAREFCRSQQLQGSSLRIGAQYLFLFCVDVALSAALLAGGATAYTRWSMRLRVFCASADKSSRLTG